MASSRSHNPPISGASGRAALLNRTSTASSARRTGTGASAGNTSISTVGNSSVLGKRGAAATDAQQGAATRRRLGTAGSSSLHPSASSASLLGGNGSSLHGNNAIGSSSAAAGGASSSSTAAQESSNANIQVAVRVRGRGAPSAPRPPDSCVITEGPRSNTITISADPLLSASTMSGPTTSLLPFASPIKKSAGKGKAGTAASASAQGEGGKDGGGGGKSGGDGQTGLSGSTNAYKKTYNFDHVFGPEADQGMVYSDVVAPILKEVLEGYNCTIFAYGQTGTGKTHTMEGDLSPHPSTGTFATDAGIIPRTLFRLFHILETSGSEYSVRASFVELYNEELRDLLAVEDAGASGDDNANTTSANTQKRGGKDASSATGSSSTAGFGAAGSGGGMRIYDDAKGRGVVIQGLEEIPITSAEAGLEILRRGSAKRHIAATNCNSQSSRSHSVFTLTIHHTTTNNLSGSQSGPPSSQSSAGGSARPILLGKDGKPLPSQSGSAAQQGEDVMRIGKLNLVDLAGSENIGRSGAADKRAREAGMINQSLLTLGRVINALVEKQSHIPFRESKLTRLLQESLGGRTKTCIIATVSESKGSIDETLSTLDYATRARSIQNRPEMNARTTRTALLSEYIAENLRLRADLKATRSKNGVFLSQETLETMEGNHARAVREAQASKLECDLAESKIQTMQEQLEQNSAVLARKEEEARHAKAEWDKARAECTRLGAALETSRKAEGEEKVLREAYMRSEQRVNGVAEGLRGVVQHSTDEVDSLLNKLARKTTVEQKNRGLMSECSTIVRELVTKLDGQVDDFKNTHERFSNGLSDSLVAFSSAQESAKEESLENVGDAFKTVEEALADLREGHTVSYERAQELAAQVSKVRESILTLFKGRAKQLQGFLDSFSADVHTRQAELKKTASSSIETLKRQTEELHTELERFVEVNEAHVADLHQLAEATIEEQRRILTDDRERIDSALVAERERAQAAKAAFLAAVQSAADDLVGGGLREFERFTAELGPPLKKRSQALDAFAKDHKAVLDDLDDQLVGLSELGAEKKKAGLDQMEALSTEVQSWNEALSERVQTFEEKDMAAFQKRCKADAEHEDRHFEELHKFVSEDAEVNKEVLDGAAAAIQTGVKNLNSAATTGLTSGSTAMQQMANSTATQIQSHRKVGIAFLDASAKGLGKVRTHIKDHLEKRVLQDLPTGSTPRRHEWKYPTAWTTMPASRSAAVQHVEQHGPGEDSFGFEYSAPSSTSTSTGRPASGVSEISGPSRSGKKEPGSPPLALPRDAEEMALFGANPIRGNGNAGGFPSDEFGSNDSLSNSAMLLLTPGRNRRAGRKTSVIAEGEVLAPGMSPIIGKENLSMVGPSTSLRHFGSSSMLYTSSKEEEEEGGDPEGLADGVNDGAAMSVLVTSPSQARTRQMPPPALPEQTPGSPPAPTPGPLSAAARLAAAVVSGKKKTRSTISKAVGTASGQLLGSTAVPSSPSGSRLLMSAAKNRASRRMEGTGPSSASASASSHRDAGGVARTPPRSSRTAR
ncbi:Kinesin- motor protein [Tilletia horrida]|nr:Kinesin- motor protein [Tilletia horrida]